MRPAVDHSVVECPNVALAELDTDVQHVRVLVLRDELQLQDVLVVADFQVLEFSLHRRDVLERLCPFDNLR